ncbi:response regulator transcription factor [Pseudonocardia sp. S2-4]|uniref:Response regulator transcription factor n=2 Tax=Pseudonocardia humida TaxID=2800819 RepID=A0ABT1A5C9_9PSEU|nr:response regulator transcription factor [Pseudonocardia humida]
MRAGLAMIIDSEDGLEVVGEADDGAEAVRAARRTRPDVVLMDVRMPGTDGITATGRLVAEDDPAKVVILTTFDADELVYEALRAGASGFLLKDAPAPELVNAVRVVAQGQAMLSPVITRRLLDDFARRGVAQAQQAPPPGLLTSREHEVLLLVAEGLSNGEIAERLVVGETTVKTHVGRVLAKLGLRDRVQAVVLAYETGLVTPRR